MQHSTITFKTAKPLLLADIKAGIVPFLVGEPGIGKSSELKHLAHDDLNSEIFVLSVNQLGTREDLTGARSIKDEKTNTYRQIFFPHAAIQDAIDYANEHPDKDTILFLDEINRAAPDVTSACLQLITERRIGTTKLPKNIRIVAAGNDKGNVSTLDKASITRMSIYWVKPDSKSWLTAMDGSLNAYVRELLLNQPSLLMAPTINQSADPDDEDDDEDEDPELLWGDENSFEQLTVPRTIDYVSQFLNQLGFTKNGDETEREAFSNYTSLDDRYGDDNILMNGLVAHIGKSELTDKLYDLIYNTCSKTFASSSDHLDTDESQIKIPTLKPSIKDIIQHATDGETLMQNLTENLHNMSDVENLILNIIDAKSAGDLNNPDALRSITNSIDYLIADVNPNVDSENIHDYNYNQITSDKFKQNIAVLCTNSNQVSTIAADPNNWDSDSPVARIINTLIGNI